MFAANYDELSERGRSQAARLGREWAAARSTEGAPGGFDAVFTGPARRHHDTAAGVAEGFGAASLPFPQPVELPGFDEHDGQALVVQTMGALARRGQRGGTVPEWAAALTPLATRAMDTSQPKAARSRDWQRMFEAVMARWIAGELDELSESGELEGVERWSSFHGRVVESFAQLRASAKGEVALFTSVGPIAVILEQVLELPPLVAFRQAWRVYNASITRVIYSGSRVTLDGFNEVAHLPMGQWTHR